MRVEISRAREIIDMPAAPVWLLLNVKCKRVSDCVQRRAVSSIAASYKRAESALEMNRYMASRR